MTAFSPEQSNTSIESVKIGDRAPDFELISDSDSRWRLSDHDGNVRVLLFYPQNETLVCTKQLCSVRDHWREYLETKAEIVGVSPSSPNENIEFSQRRSLPMPLLADPGRVVTGIFSRHWIYPIQLTRAIVVIDAHGIVRTRMVMLRAFRPKDDDVITAIYAARIDALNEKSTAIRSRAFKVFNKS